MDKTRDGINKERLAKRWQRQRERRNEHREQVNEQQRHYRATHHEQVNGRRRHYRAAHPEQVNEHQRHYRVAHPEQVNELPIFVLHCIPSTRIGTEFLAKQQQWWVSQ